MSRQSMTIAAGRRSRSLLFGLCAMCMMAGRCWGQQTMPDEMATTDDNNAAARAIYSPMLDYNNVWTPIGHGDPLKTPTVHDYSPPQLDRVRYWAETGAAAPESAPPSPAAALNALLGSAAGYQSNRAAYHNPHSNVVHKTKSDILLLGVPATKRAAQFKSVDQAPRRNYYAQLPTVLMPPPMQTLTPPSASGQQQQQQQSQQQRPYHHYHYSTPNHYQQWPATDAHPAESSLYTSSVLPPDPNSVGVTHAAPVRKRPWIQELLQKEVTPPVSSTSTTTIVSMVPASPVYESHITQEVRTTSPPPLVSTHAHTKPQPLWPQQPSTMSYTMMMPSMSYSSHPYTSVAHPHLSNHIFATTMWDTTTHFTPTVRPHMVPSAAAAASSTPTITMTTDSPFSQHSKHRPPVNNNGPAYMIIEGHSKVKTYGNSPAGRHEPNVRPVQSTVDPVVVQVRLDERAEALRRAEDERRFEVRHLHYKQPPSAEQREDDSVRAATTTTTTAATLMTTLQQTIEEGVAETTTTPTRMSAGLLSLLDTSFGDFFSDNETDNGEEERTEAATMRPTATTTTSPTIPTTKAPTAVLNEATTTSAPEATTDNIIDNADLGA